MAKKDMRNNIVVNTFTSGTAVDLLGYNSFTFAAVVAEAGAISFKVEESDDNSNFKDVTDTMVVGPVAYESVTSAQIGYKGDCRYVKVTVTATSPTCIFVAAQPDLAPTV